MEEEAEEVVVVGRTHARGRRAGVVVHGVHARVNSYMYMRMHICKCIHTSMEREHTSFSTASGCAWAKSTATAPPREAPASTCSQYHLVPSLSDPRRVGRMLIKKARHGSDINIRTDPPTILRPLSTSRQKP